MNNSQSTVAFQLAKLFYAKLGEQPANKRVLVIGDLFTAMHASIENDVTFVTDDKDSYYLFNKNVASNDEFDKDVTAMLVDTKKAWKDFIKELASMPKFDVALINSSNDVNIEKVIQHAEKAVIVNAAA